MEIGLVVAVVLICMTKCCAHAMIKASSALSAVCGLMPAPSLDWPCREFEAGGGIDPADAMPLYIRNKVALKEKER